MTNRWWTYQKERFPIVKHGILIAVLSASAVGYSLMLRGQTAQSMQAIGSGVIAFITLFLLFLQLRIIDEFKDFREDARYRPYRPVPRGLVTLRELAIVGIAAAAIELGLAMAMGVPLVLLLFLVWAYLGLMSQEFFAAKWLKSRPLAYMLSHAVVLPWMALYATACDWGGAGAAPSADLIGFLLVSFFSGLVIEVGRKIRAPNDEEPGVATYSALWGRQRAVTVWLGLIWAIAVTALLAAKPIGAIAPVAIVSLLLLTGSLIVAWQFLIHLKTTWAKRLEWISKLGTLLVYLSVGVVPLLRY